MPKSNLLTRHTFCQDEYGFDLVRRLLQTDVHKRLGSSKQTGNGKKERDSVGFVEVSGVAAIKAHPFYSSLDWGAVSRHETFPEFIPPKVSLLLQRLVALH